MTRLDNDDVLHDRGRHKSTIKFVFKAVADTSATDAQLTIQIIPDTKDTAVAEQSTSVLPTAGDVCDVGHESHSCWSERPISGVFVPQLAPIIQAPAPKRAFLVNGAVVVTSSTDHHSRVRGISQRDRMRSCALSRCAQHVVIVNSNALQSC